MSDPGDLKVLATYLDRLMALDEGLRETFLQQVEAEQPALGERLRRLWTRQTATGELFDEPLALAEATETLPQAEGAELPPPKHLGPYRILGEIGRGGMGRVYLGERADGQFERRVAIKLIRRDGEEHDRARFDLERQILAKLNHPNIAPLLDSGIDEVGRPYFIMEYLKGLPITEYCDRKRLNIHQRLKLFLAVCEAVQYAHQNLVIHRDLKPSNILVEEDGTVRLLDFGIAKLLEEEKASVASRLTLSGRVVLTPDCASPEQITGGSITTGSDIYALGVLLYRLLTGRRTIPTGVPEVKIWDAIIHEDPPVPSTVVLQADSDEENPKDPVALASLRAMNPDELSKTLSGELDAVVMKSLRKDSAKRYATVDQLARDLRHFLMDYPVSAHAGTWIYRAKKFVRRHRFGFAVVTGVFILAVGFAATLSVLTARVARERDKAARVSEFMQEMLRYADPTRKGRAARVYDFLEAANRRIEMGFTGQPESKGVLLRVLAETYEGLGEWEKSLAHIRQSREILTSTLGESHPETLISTAILAHVFRNLNRHEEARDLYLQVIDAYERQYAPRHEKVIDAKINLAGLLVDMGAFEDARAELDALRKMARDDISESDWMRMEEVSARIDVWLGRWQEATAKLRSVYEFGLRKYGEENPQTLDFGSDYAMALTKIGRFHEARDVLLNNLSAGERLYGPDHPDLDQMRYRLAVVFKDLDDQEASNAIIDRVLRFREATYGEAHHASLVAKRFKGLLLLNQDEFGKAEELISWVLASYIEQFGEHHPNAIALSGDLAKVYRMQGNYSESLKVYRKTADLAALHLGEKHPHVIAVQKNMAQIFNYVGLYEDGEKYGRQSMSLALEVLGNTHPFYLAAQASLAESLEGLGRLQEAEDLIRESYEQFAATLGPDHAHTRAAREVHQRILDKKEKSLAATSVN